MRQIFEIVPEETYIDDYNALLDIAGEEKENGARSAIEGSIDDISQYDIIYVGYLSWWSDMPMILYTFFDSYDLSGKSIAPFYTSGGSGLNLKQRELITFCFLAARGGYEPQFIAYAKGNINLGNDRDFLTYLFMRNEFVFL